MSFEELARRLRKAGMTLEEFADKGGLDLGMLRLASRGKVGVLADSVELAADRVFGPEPPDEP